MQRTDGQNAQAAAETSRSNPTENSWDRTQATNPVPSAPAQRPVFRPTGATFSDRRLHRERVLLGFPGAGGVRHGETIRYLILNRREQPTTIGEIGGIESTRIKAIANALMSAGLPTSICANMDAWLKTHVAEICPTVAAFYMADGDIAQWKRDRNSLVLMIRAIREGHRVLSANRIPVTPASHRMFQWIPEFLLVAIARRKLADNAAIIKIGHASAAHDEMTAIASEFRELVRRSGIKTPALDQLSMHLRKNVHSENCNDKPTARPMQQTPHEIETA